uniref:PNK FHA domain-containing protein n=1 Tax=Xiphophorus couchianus TaxID=32473 RepID=A0A3B5LY36_9TELE
MSGFGLVPVDGGDLVPLPPGETVLGRGPFLGTHINPCFLLSSPNDDPRPLERGSWHRLHPGDQFSLLPGRFIYRVAPRYPPPRRCHGDGGASVTTRMRLTTERCFVLMSFSTPRLDGVQSDEAPPPPRRRVLPAWMMAAAAASASKGNTATIVMATSYGVTAGA